MKRDRANGPDVNGTSNASTPVRSLRGYLLPGSIFVSAAALAKFLFLNLIRARPTMFMCCGPINRTLIRKRFAHDRTCALVK